VNHYVEMKERKRLLNEEIDVELARWRGAYAYAGGRNSRRFAEATCAKIKLEMKEKYPLKVIQSENAG